ncbi:MAG: low specificity L-threonine aldolase [Butyrivibrio sp.]|nr:low specificity L-threonine aldolase [Butyrivibrio sp.]
MKKDLNEKIFFASDYMEGAHPQIMQRLIDTNLVKTPGYGTDSYCESARNKIRTACSCPDADVFFLAGGTQTNATVIDAVLRSYQGVIAAQTGHIQGHEAGAIEAGGHKVLTLSQQFGKISANQIAAFMSDYENDANHEHTVMPGMVYLSQPTEYGTLYSLAELKEIREVCSKYSLSLYVDGARLAYALSCPENDVTLQDLAALTDAFYIGGTKCGTLFGEAVVIPKHDYIPHFFTTVKQHGALLAKGRLLGIQFDTLFTDDLYLHIGAPAIDAAEQIRFVLRECGYTLYFEAPTNQIFVVMENDRLRSFGQQVEYGFWEKYDDTHTVIRLATSWATTGEDTDALIRILRSCS